MSHLPLALFSTGLVLAAQSQSSTPAPVFDGIGIHSEGAAPIQANFQGSVPAERSAGSLPLTLQDAIARGLKNNLGILVLDSGIRIALAQRTLPLGLPIPKKA